MNHKKQLLILLIISISLVLSSCAGSSTMTATGWAGLAVDEETVYVSFNSHVIAVNLANGTEKWRFPLEADTKISFYAPPAILEDGDLIVGGYDNILYKVAAATGQGQPLFDQAEGRYVGGPLVSDDMIYAPSADHFIYALDMDGTLAWSFETEEPLWAKPVASPDCHCIYLPSMDHRVYALDAQDGSLLWKTEVLGGSIVGTPTISEDQKLYVGTFANEMIAIDGKDGSILWRFPTTNWVWSGPALFNDILYFGDLNGTLFAVDRQTGQSTWQIQTTASIVGQPLVREDGIYFTIEDGTVQAVTFEGTTRWTLPFEASLQEGPLDAGDLIIVATSSPESLLIAINPNGTQVWTYAFERR